jgi:hypothetical protein
MGYASGDGVVNTGNIVDSAVTAAKLGASAVTTAKINDDAVTLAKLAAGTDGELITWDANGDPAAVGVGTVGQVLTSGGAGVAPAFAAAAATGLPILQVQSDSGAEKSTTSTSYVDTNFSLSITMASSSNTLLIYYHDVVDTTAGHTATYQIVVNSSAGELCMYKDNPGSSFGTVNINQYASPATSGAITVKVQYKTNAGTARSAVNNYGQLIAIELDGT